MRRDLYDNGFEPSLIHDTMDQEKKRIERWFLASAREAGVPLPRGEVPGEKPDFRFWTGSAFLGVELSEVLRPASSNFGLSPVAEESLHREIIEDARKLYYASSGAKPVHVRAYFASTRGRKHDKRTLARELKEFVLSNVESATPSAGYFRASALRMLSGEHQELPAPDGFDAVLLDTQLCPGVWLSGEAGGITISDIRPAVEASISAKDKLVDAYRKNLPEGTPLWLLLYSSVTVARSIPIPFGAREWRIRSHFDRVFWFAALERQFVEIRQDPR